jgi:hypothetical protein
LTGSISYVKVYNVLGLGAIINEPLQTGREVIAPSVWRWVTGWTIEALGPTRPPIQWVAGALSLGVKRPVREADHSPPSSAEVNNEWNYTSTPPIGLHGVVLS